jgi:hypothetical protein
VPGVLFRFKLMCRRSADATASGAALASKGRLIRCTVPVHYYLRSAVKLVTGCSLLRVLFKIHVIAALPQGGPQGGRYQRWSKIMSHELVFYVVTAVVVGSIAATVWLTVEAIAERLLR